MSDGYTPCSRCNWPRADGLPCPQCGWPRGWTLIHNVQDFNDFIEKYPALKTQAATRYPFAVIYYETLNVVVTMSSENILRFASELAKKETKLQEAHDAP